MLLCETVPMSGVSVSLPTKLDIRALTILGPSVHSFPILVYVSPLHSLLFLNAWLLCVHFIPILYFYIIYFHDIL